MVRRLPTDNLLVVEALAYSRRFMVDMNRYARHVSLPDVGREGQELINNSRILVIGAGRTRAVCFTLLLPQGRQNHGVIDDDLVDLSNLQEQIIHAESDVGSSKVESATKIALSINSTIK